MKLVITPSAQRQIDNQFQYGVARHGHRTAQRTFSRVERFFLTTLVEYPRTGTYIAAKQIYERLIPRTPFVVIYRLETTQDIVRVLGVFHHAQNWADFDPD